MFKLLLSARGSLISINSDNPIINSSSILTSIKEKENDNFTENWLDVDPNSLHFWINFFIHTKSLQFSNILLKDKITKSYFTKIIKNPDLITAAQYLGIDIELDKWYI